MITIAVVVPHLPERDPGLYERACLSIVEQTRQPDQLIIEWDPTHSGCAATQNRALARVNCDFLALLGDDDYFLPHHLETLEQHAAFADVVYPDCQQIGRQYDFIGGPFDAERLRESNYIPGGGTLIRTDAARAVGGWCKFGDLDRHEYEDWVMWLRLLDAGYRFKHVPEVTWAYRFGAHQTGGQL